MRNPLRKSANGPIKRFVLSVKLSITTQRFALKNQVAGVSGDINYDLGTEIGEKLEENDEAV